MATGSNRHLRFIAIAGVLALAAFADVLLSGSGAPKPAAYERPRLAVLVVFDQMRGDYLERWQELYAAEGGFRRLEQEGAWFQNCHYPYAHTVTAAGHASILTGCSPDKHGIVGNEWFDRESGAEVTSVSAERHEQVPPLAPQKPGPDGRVKKNGGTWPKRLLAESLGDALKTATGGKGKVFGLSMKDRAAILPTGHHADACFWFDDDTGVFCTSTYYRDRLPPWVADLNKSRFADQWFGRDWLRFRTDIDYTRFSGPDDVEGEGKGFAQGRTFPHPTAGGLKQPGKNYHRAVFNSPFGNELLVELAKRAIDAEQLGQRDTPDLLTISFSSNDSIGHTWGPDSHEVLDVTLRSDLIVRELLNHLDAKVGRGRYVLAMTADHGICPLPEVSRARGLDAGRIAFNMLAAEAEAFLCAHYSPIGGSARWFECSTFYPWFYFNRALLKELKIEQAEAEAALAHWLDQQPGVKKAYTRTQLERPRPASADERIWKSYHPRCGDVTVIPKPYWIFNLPFAGGTTHGTPYPYDTHVPLRVYGPGILPGVRSEPITPQATAAILAKSLGIPPPREAEVAVPDHLWAEQ
jgi:hypothetical protein